MNNIVHGVHLYATLSMVGLIWFVQVVHYPLMECANREDFKNFERLHQNRTTWVVMPLMLAEFASSLALLLRPGMCDRRLAAVSFGLLLSIWLSTFFIQVPLHARLENGFDAAAHAKLVSSNWIRTVGWSLRGIIALRLASIF